MAQAKIIEKGFLDEETAKTRARYYDAGADSYTSYNVQQYETEETLKFGTIKVK